MSGIKYKSARGRGRIRQAGVEWNGKPVGVGALAANTH